MEHKHLGLPLRNKDSSCVVFLSVKFGMTAASFAAPRNLAPIDRLTAATPIFVSSLRPLTPISSADSYCFLLSSGVEGGSTPPCIDDDTLTLCVCVSPQSERFLLDYVAGRWSCVPQNTTPTHFSTLWSLHFPCPAHNNSQRILSSQGEVKSGFCYPAEWEEWVTGVTTVIQRDPEITRSHWDSVTGEGCPQASAPPPTADGKWSSCRWKDASLFFFYTSQISTDVSGCLFVYKPSHEIKNRSDIWKWIQSINTGRGGRHLLW